jgi:methylated-DNA-[protein]-cysteine S-methyltransferase
MKLFTDTFRSPFGPFSIAVNETGAVVGTAFGDETALQMRVKKHALTKDAALVRATREQVLAYFAGERRDFDLPLAAEGTPFQQRVWAALCRIRFGDTCTYRELATRLGNAGAARAVGRANATNPICLIVPCHRVIGADGSLTGFAFGEDIKRRLLEHEHARAQRAA